MTDTPLTPSLTPFSKFDTIPIMVDLHTHSNISDGDLSPSALIKQAVKHKLTAIALTDHDTLGGLEGAKAEATASGIRFIPGIEINIDWTGKDGVTGLGNGGEFHLLGLGLNNPSAEFTKAVDELSKRRIARNYKILDKMYELSIIDNIDAAYEELVSLSAGTEKSQRRVGEGTERGRLPNSIGRLHFALLLVKKKVVKNVGQAFDRYLGAGKPLYEQKEGMKFDKAAALIRKSGGIPVLAHPASLYVSWSKLPDLIKTLKNQGLAGLEAWHPTAKTSTCRRLENLAKELGLYITEGSDYHGTVRPERRLGYSSTGRKIEEKVLEAIPELGVNSFSY